MLDIKRISSYIIAYIDVGIIIMPTKGQKNEKGKPELYDEVKKVVAVSLTPTAQQLLKEKAKEYGLSVSEFVESIARGSIAVGKKTRQRWSLGSLLRS
ncbi:MAG: hypothetical protein NHB32_08445 [Fischerella sp. CENA71]|nr:hypothetical protein [Fischerella sp. CENA71]